MKQKVKKLTKKERKLDIELECKKNFIAYENVKLYASTDIPIPSSSGKLDGQMMTPPIIWQDFDPQKERLDYVLLSQDDSLSVYSFCALHMSEGLLNVKITCYAPSFESKKAILLVGEYARVPQSSLIDSLVKRGFYVFYADYNNVSGDNVTRFPEVYSYGERGKEGSHLNTLCPTAKETCQYLYTLINRRALTFINEVYPGKDIIALGVRTGVEIAMQTAGTERDRIIALACICGAGYPEYASLPKYSSSGSTMAKVDKSTLAFTVGASGVSYLKNYPHPMFVAVGSNDTYSDVDRLSMLKRLISGNLTANIVQKYADSIDDVTWLNCLTWLDYVNWTSAFPVCPVTTIEVKNDGSVYANIRALTRPRIKKLTFYYSYNNYDHRSRQWESVTCETTGNGQYIAKLEFTKHCTGLFYYTEAVCVNGLIVAETPTHIDLSAKRITLVPAKANAVLFRHGSERQFIPVGSDAIAHSDRITEFTSPSGIKGTVCSEGSMKLFVGDACMSVAQKKLLQVDAFIKGQSSPLELSVVSGKSGTVYRAIKHVTEGNTFVGTEFACTDFKDDTYKPLTSWAGVSSVTIVTPNVAVNKLTFI